MLPPLSNPTPKLAEKGRYYYTSSKKLTTLTIALPVESSNTCANKSVYPKNLPILPARGLEYILITQPRDQCGLKCVYYPFLA